MYRTAASLGITSGFAQTGCRRTQLNLYPAKHYIRRLPIWTVHKFTMLILACLLVVGIVEITPLGILFPMFLCWVVPVQILAEWFFTQEELAALGSEEEPEDEETPWR